MTFNSLTFLAFFAVVVFAHRLPLPWSVNRRLPADLRVIATHGHGAVFDLLVGSVSHAVLRGATIPVLLVPPHAAGGR